MTNQPPCPVCGRPYSPEEAICPECGWELHGPYILGPITREEQLRYERDLAQARLAYRERQFQQAQAQLAALASELSREREQAQAQLAALEASLKRAWINRITPANAAAVVQRARLGKGWVTDMAWTPDGTHLAVASTIGVFLYDASTLEEVRYIPTDAPVGSIAFAPDGQTLASGADDRTVRLWRVADGTLLRTLEGHPSEVWSVAFAPDGQTLASGSYRTVRLWRVADGVLLRTLEGHTDWVRSVAFAPDGQTLASGSWDGTVRLWGLPE